MEDFRQQADRIYSIITEAEKKNRMLLKRARKEGASEFRIQGVGWVSLAEYERLSRKFFHKDLEQIEAILRYEASQPWLWYDREGTVHAQRAQDLVGKTICSVDYLLDWYMVWETEVAELHPHRCEKGLVLGLGEEGFPVKIIASTGWHDSQIQILRMPGNDLMDDLEEGDGMAQMNHYGWENLIGQRISAVKSWCFPIEHSGYFEDEKLYWNPVLKEFTPQSVTAHQHLQLTFENGKSVYFSTGDWDKSGNFIQPGRKILIHFEESEALNWGFGECKFE